MDSAFYIECNVSNDYIAVSKVEFYDIRTARAHSRIFAQVERLVKLPF